MASSASTTSIMTKAVVILDKPSDWDEWFFLVRSKTQDGDVEKFIDLNSAIEPPQLREPAKPMPNDIKPTATSLTDLTSDQRDLFRLLRDGYKSDLSRYERKRADLVEIKNYVLSTISRQNLTFVIGKETLYQIL
jgi:hypothetical protein